MIQFQKMSFKNLLSFGDQPTTIEFDKFTTTLITGKNGHGKSTFLDALTFVLYGKPFRKINKPQLVNSVNKKNLMVEIFFTSGGTEYHVKRGIKPNIFEIYENGLLIDQDGSVNDYQLFFEKNVLQMNYTAFTQVVILGKATYVPFMRLGTPERRTVVEDILGLSIFSQMNKVLRGKITSLKMAKTEAEGDVRAAETAVDGQEHYISQIERNRQLNIDNINRSIEDIDGAIASTNGNIATLESSKLNVASRVEDAQWRVDKARKAADEAIRASEQALERRNAMLEPDETNTILADIKMLKKRRESLREIRTKFKYKTDDLRQVTAFLSDNTDCPTCKQPIDEEFRATEVSKKTVKLEQLAAGGVKLQDELQAINERMDKHDALLDSIHEQEKAIREADESVRYTQEDVRIRQAVVREEELKVDVARQSGAKTDELIEAKRTSVVEYERMRKVHYAQLTAAQKEHDSTDDADRLAKFNLELKAATERKAALFETGGYYTAISGMLKDSGIKTLIIQKYLPIFNTLINKYLNEMGFFIQFELDEEFNETILSRYRDNFSYASFSEGQKLRIDLAILLTWRDIAKRKNSLTTNLLIMDEVFDSSLDQGGVDSFVDMIPNMVDTNIFIVSHTPDKLVDRFAAHLSFDMDGNFSVMKS